MTHDRKRVDMIDRVFGRLIVVDLHDITPLGQRRWLCLCECGQSSVAYGGHLRAGRIRSCGCLRRDVAPDRARDDAARAKLRAHNAAVRAERWESERGRLFGRLTPTAMEMRGQVPYWTCSCVCGGSVTVPAVSVRSGNTRSCGCLRAEVREQLKAAEGRSIARWKEAHA